MLTVGSKILIAFASVAVLDSETAAEHTCAPDVGTLPNVAPCICSFVRPNAVFNTLCMAHLRSGCWADAALTTSCPAGEL